MLKISQFFERVERTAVSSRQKPAVGVTFCIYVAREIVLFSGKSQGIRCTLRYTALVFVVAKQSVQR